MRELAARLSAQRMRMLDLHPFWGHLLLQLRLIPEPSLPALAATDGRSRIWYHPGRLGALDDDQLGFVLAHEVGHLVQASLERARGRDPFLWNQATDYAINRIVASLRHPRRGGPLYRPVPGLLLDRRFDGLIAEAIYERLSEEGGAGRPEPVTVEGQPAQDHGGGLDVHVAGDPSEADREELLARLRAAVAFAEAQPERGDVPAGVQRALEEGRRRVRWQAVLRRFVAAALNREDHDPRRPHRRWAAHGLYLPTLAGERVGEVVVALDTSGSMGEAQLASACAELRALAREVLELRLVVADARVQEVVGLDDLEGWLGRRRARGGGGTDHRPVFEWIRRSGVAPDLFVGLTDLWSRFPERPPPFPVVWVVPSRHGSAPFGAVVEVGEP